MIGNFLLLVGIVVVIISYLRIFILKFQNGSRKVPNLSGFDIAKEITANYDEINIVESKEVVWSQYNLRRKVIRLTPKNYGASDIFSLSLSACLSGISLANIYKDKYLAFFSKIFSNIDCIGKSSILAILISLFTGTIGDAKIGIVLLGIVLVYQYFLIQIHTVSCHYAQEALGKLVEENDRERIVKIQKAILSSHTFAFVVTLILLLREVLFILNFGL